MDYQEYRRRVWGCYTGNAVGGTLGMPRATCPRAI